VAKARAKTILERVKTILERVKTILERAKTILERVKTILERAKTILERAKTILERAKTILERAKTILERAKTILERAKTILERAKIVKIPILGLSKKHSRDTRGQQARQGAADHRFESQSGQVSTPPRCQRPDPTDLNPDRGKIGKPAQRKGRQKN
jgi:exonuclease VII small subunit